MFTWNDYLLSKGKLHWTDDDQDDDDDDEDFTVESIIHLDESSADEDSNGW